MQKLYITRNGFGKIDGFPHRKVTFTSETLHLNASVVATIQLFVYLH